MLVMYTKILKIKLLRPTVIDDVCFVPLNYGLQDYKERGNGPLEVTGLSSLRNEFIWQLSGGQKHLLAISRGTCYEA